MEKLSTTGVEQDFVAALRAGKICLHPTDSIPGLSFDPRLDANRQKLDGIKGRDAVKSYIGLLANLDMARIFWRPLPGNWFDVLSQVWPAPLSVVWEAAPTCPISIVGKDGSVAFRLPQLAPDMQWLLRAIQELGCPMPTTSVNDSGQEPLTVWDEAVRWLDNKSSHTYVPTLKSQPRFSPQPSTVIKIIDGERFQVLREGRFATATLRSQWGKTPC